MRRGLMAWDADELPLDTLKARIAKLQAALVANGQDAILLYTNFIRSGAVSHLTAFSPYWADGILMVPKSGEPVFATTLSNRVASWVESVKPIGILVHSPTPGVALAERLKTDPDLRQVSILELDAFPGGVYDEFAGNLPGIAIVDGSAVFAASRAELDDAERRLLAHADAIAADALAIVDPATMGDAGAIVGEVEAYARLAGAEEAYIAIVPDLDADTRFQRVASAGPLGRRFAVRATIAYKGSWVRRIKTFGHDQAALDVADRWFLGLTIEPGQPMGAQLAAGLKDLPGATLEDWMAETVVGTRPLAPLASAKHGDCGGAAPALVLTVRLTIDGRPWYGARLVGILA